MAGYKIQAFPSKRVAQAALFAYWGTVAFAGQRQFLRSCEKLLYLSYSNVS